MLVEFITDYDSPSGYSSFVRSFIKALYNAGVGIKITPNKHDKTTIPLDEFWSEHAGEFVTNQGRPDIRMHVETPEFFRSIPGILNIGYTFWETDKIPGFSRPGEPSPPPHFNWVKQMNLMDEMWTAAESAKEAFHNSGVKCPVRILGIPMEFLEDKKELPITGITVDQSGKKIPREDRRIVIGSVAQFNFRKNIEDLIISVCSEFRSHEVVLLLKTYGSQQNDPQQEELIRKRVMGLKNVVGWKDIPQIVLVQNTLTDIQMRQLYNSMDIFVTATRGEGFCIPAAQAMGSGVPTICTGWSAMMDFVLGENDGKRMIDQTGWPVRYQMEPVYGMPFIPWYRPDQRWARINMPDLMRTMRKVYEGVKNGDETIKEVAANGAKRVRELYSPEAIGRIGKAHLEAALGRD